MISIFEEIHLIKYYNIDKSKSDNIKNNTIIVTDSLKYKEHIFSPRNDIVVEIEIEHEKDIEEESVKSLAVTDKKIEKYLEGNEIKKIIYVPGKIINIVI